MSVTLTLEQLIDECHKIRERVFHERIVGNAMLEPEVRYDFARFYPNDIFSWRGSYDQLALNYARDFRNDPPKRLSEFLTMLEQAVGADFDGYKGGEYTMDLDTCVWIDDWGDYTSTGITGVTYNGTDVIIHTRHVPWEEQL